MPSLFYTATILMVCASFAVGTASDAFEDYMVKFGRSYKRETPEFVQRQQLFRQKLERIDAHNARPDRLWTAGINSLTDRTDEEFSQLLGWRRHARSNRGSKSAALLMESAKIVESVTAEVDWSKLQMSAKVPDQGACGSCWAVAAASFLEASYEAQTNKSRTFSAQQLVNCVPNPKECGGTGGCKGATVELAMQYVDQMGLEEDHAVPYQAADATCEQRLPGASFLEARRLQRNKGASMLGIKSWSTLPENKALPLMQAVMKGPVAISVAASDWNSYSSGIFDGCSKDATINHAVVLFGYSQDSSAKYWNVRNSWSSDWGEKGFIRLLRQDTPQDEDNFCGTDNDPKAGIACKPYPDTQKVCGMCGMLFDSVAVDFEI